MTVIIRVRLLDGTFKALAITNSTTAEHCVDQLIKRLCKDENSRTSDDLVLKTRERYSEYNLYRSGGNSPLALLNGNDVVWCSGDFSIAFLPSNAAAAGATGSASNSTLTSTNANSTSATSSSSTSSSTTAASTTGSSASSSASNSNSNSSSNSNSNSSSSGGGGGGGGGGGNTNAEQPTFLATVNLLDGTFKSLRLPTTTTTKECLDLLYRKLCKGIPTPPKVEAVKAEFKNYGLFLVNQDASKRALAANEELLATCGKDATFVFAPSEQAVTVTSLASVQAVHGHRFVQHKITKPKKCKICSQNLPMTQDIIRCSVCKLRIHPHCSLSISEQCRSSTATRSKQVRAEPSKPDTTSSDVRRRLSIAPAENITPGMARSTLGRLAGGLSD
jgi:hypothetical protein